MNYIEKLRQDYPDWDEFKIGYTVADKCPEELGYPEDCDHDCEHCWYKEFPSNEKLNDVKKENEITMTNPKKTKGQLIEELKEATEKATALENEIKNLEKYKQYDDAANEIHAFYHSFVKAGFSEEQSYDLLKMTWQLAMSNNVTASLQKVVRR
jgi:hypothetical protein